jgi:hypothetical protein
MGSYMKHLDVCMHTQHVMYTEKNLGLWSASSSHVKYEVTNFVFYISTQDCCVGTRTPLYLTFPEDGASALKHVGIVLYDV